MKGTDVTDDQYNAAQNFITKFVMKIDAPAPDQLLTMKWEDFIRTIAWYGAIRAEGAARGLNPNASRRVALVPNPLALVPGAPE